MFQCFLLSINLVSLFWLKLQQWAGVRVCRWVELQRWAGISAMGRSLSLTYSSDIPWLQLLGGHIGTGLKIIQCKTIIMYFHKDEILLSAPTYKGFINDRLSGPRCPAYSHIKQAGAEMLLLLPTDINQCNTSPHHLRSPRPSPLLFKWIGGALWLVGWCAARFRRGDGVTP